jgi:hypothetical protein
VRDAELALDDGVTFDALVDRIREPLAELEAHVDELELPVRDFVRGMRAALTRYDEAEA